MMNCETTERQLGAYVDGEVSPTLREQIESHVTQCPACQAELRELRELAVTLARADALAPPPGLWVAIERRLQPSARPRRRFFDALSRRPALALAACIAVVVGLGLIGLPWTTDQGSQVHAAAIDFSLLLDALQHDAVVAFDKFLAQYHAKPASPSEAKRFAPALNFELPQVLPGGFQLEATYVLRFGDNPGVAGRYMRNGEFLGVLFHPPVLQEDFGTHGDHECVVGKHRGHKVPVGEWSLVHLTDATTCHCLLSRLDEGTEIPAVMAAVAPAAGSASESAHHGALHDHP